MIPEQCEVTKGLKTYFQKFWMEKITPEIFVVSDLSFRTNNSCEGFHSKFVKFLRRKPNLWILLKKINRTNTLSEIKINRINKGNLKSNAKKSKYINFNNILMHKINMLRKGTLSLEQFMLGVNLDLKKEWKS